MNTCVGVLALQGAYQKHVECLTRLNVKSRLIRKPCELDQCSGLIIPGGESTTMSLLINDSGMFEPLRDFAQDKPVMGVCAGLILMATEVNDKRISPLGLIPFRALRNYYGRQAHSFTAEIMLNFDDSHSAFHAHFIRAPGIGKLSTQTEILASYNNEVIMISSGKHIALSFHPEISHDNRIYDYWLSRCS